MNVFVTGSFTFLSGCNTENVENCLGTAFLYQNQSFEHETSLALCLMNSVLIDIGFVVVWLCFGILMHCSIVFYFWPKFCDYIHKSIVQSNYAFNSNATFYNDTLDYSTGCSIVETSKQLVFIRKSVIDSAVLFLVLFWCFALCGTFSDALKWEKNLWRS